MPQLGGSGSFQCHFSHWPSPVLRNWVIKGFGMSGRVFAAGHIKEPLPFIRTEQGIVSRWRVSFLLHLIVIPWDAGKQ